MTNEQRIQAARETIRDHADALAAIVEREPTNADAPVDVLMLESIAHLMAAVAMLNRDTGKLAEAVHDAEAA